MSLDYAAGLSHYDDLGVCGLDEILDESQDLEAKIECLAKLLVQYRGSCVVHAGAGLSTSAGIPDFRGKNGVWTKMLEGNHQGMGANSPELKKEDLNSSDKETKPAKHFDETVPTAGHLVLRELCRLGYVNHIVSQNVDGLFLKSNLERRFISELHGNFYLDECTKCRSRFIRGTSSETMCLTKSHNKCPRQSQKSCTGRLRDTILDWESPIPYNELRVATKESKRSKLHICIGTSMQLRPSKDLVCKPEVGSNKLVIINLQPIQFSQRANLVINYYADDVLEMLANKLAISIPKYDPTDDPTKNPKSINSIWQK